MNTTEITLKDLDERLKRLERSVNMSKCFVLHHRETWDKLSQEDKDFYFKTDNFISDEERKAKDLLVERENKEYYLRDVIKDIKRSKKSYNEFRNKLTDDSYKTYFFPETRELFIEMVKDINPDLYEKYGEFLKTI